MTQIVYPVVETYSFARPYRHLWMMYVDGVDLNEHCLKCLRGTRSRKIGHEIGHEIGNEITAGPDMPPIVLDEAVTPFYYICGETGNWNNNLHIAFVRSERNDGAEWIEVKTEREHWVIRNAVKIDISEDFIDKNDPHYVDERYRTCRNWQFAYYVKKRLDGEIGGE